MSVGCSDERYDDSDRKRTSVLGVRFLRDAKDLEHG